VKLYEHQARELFAGHGIPVLPGRLASTPEEARAAAATLGGRVAVKAQVLAGGRGKAGGVALASTPAEAAGAAERVLGMRIASLPVRNVLLVPAVRISAELYAAVTVDRAERALAVIVSASGGVDIEELAASRPDDIHTLRLNPLKPPERSSLLAFLTPVFGSRSEELWDILNRMLTLFVQRDCSLVEINPLAVLGDGSLSALDAKVIIDENALYKHPDLHEWRNPEEYGPMELEARSHGLSFIQMDGNIGCVVNGAGLAMATMDLITLAGGEPANFLDVGGSSSPEKVVHAFDIISRNPRVEAVLVNIFGGITRCDDVARGIIQAVGMSGSALPLVIRLIGTNEREGHRLLEEQGIRVFERLTDAVQDMVSRVRGLT
jgi:succinyl-CoA synthetase beta subunit